MITQDMQARRRALTEHDRTLLVEAGAGSGKTALLAGRVALMLAAGIAPGTITAITFTEAAASELRERVTHYVSRLLRNDIPHELAPGIPTGLSEQQSLALTQAMHALDELACSTIHSFCQRLIAPYCVEAAIDPGAAVLEASAGALLRSDTIDVWLANKLDRIPTQEAHEHDDIVFALVEIVGIDVVSELRTWAEYFCVNRGAVAAVVDETLVELRELVKAIESFEHWYSSCGIREFATEAYISSLSALRESLPPYRAAALSSREVVRCLNHERPSTCRKAESSFLLYRCKGKWGDAAKSAGRSKLEGERLNLEATALYQDCADAYTAWLAATVDIACARIVQSFSDIHLAYTAKKQRSAVLDFDDLLLHARDVVRDHPQVRAALTKRHRHILVDEFQDTDPLQAELLWHLCAQHVDSSVAWHEFALREGSLFVVADPKQAIYRFRGADIQTYLIAKQSICVRMPEAFLEINTNFRSDERILDYVNATFQSILQADDQPGFTALAAAHAHDASRPALQSVHVDLDELVRDRNGNLSIDALRTAEARAVAECIAGMLADGSVVDRRTRKVRACTPSDIALLAATGGKSLGVYERELDILGIPLATQAGKGFFGRQEVHDLIALVRTLADAHDTLAFGAFVRGPLIGLSEVEIAEAVVELNARGERLYLYTDPLSVSHPLLRITLEQLQYFARRALRTTPYQLLAEACDVFEVWPICKARAPRSYERLLQNVEKFLTMARAYDVRGLLQFALSLRQKWLAQESMEEGRGDTVDDALVVSTMHSSKGLEWPVVIPVNSMTKLDGKPLSFLSERETGIVHFKVLGEFGRAYERHSDAERLAHRSEAARLWYVALTRARDVLIVPHIAERPANDWMSVINLASGDLPVFDGVARRYRSDIVEAALPQDLAAWESQARRIASLKKTVAVHYPSRHDNEALEIYENLADVFAGDSEIETASIVGGRERGLCLHKLLEEIIQLELGTQEAEIRARAEVLIAQLGSERAAAVSPDELAACVARTIALPRIAALLPRLSAEVPVYVADESADGIAVTAGVMDAVAFAADGSCEIVIDWKSDVVPANAPLGEYRGQLQTYLKACGAKRGYLVFATTGEIVEV